MRVRFFWIRKSAPRTHFGPADLDLIDTDIEVSAICISEGGDVLAKAGRFLFFRLYVAVLPFFVVDNPAGLIMIYYLYIERHLRTTSRCLLRSYHNVRSLNRLEVRRLAKLRIVT